MKWTPLVFAQIMWMWCMFPCTTLFLKEMFLSFNAYCISLWCLSSNFHETLVCSLVFSMRMLLNASCFWVVEMRALNNQFDCENGNKVSSKEGKGTRIWKKVKYQLIEYHALPSFLRDNEFILGYYRSEWPLKQVFLSIFSIHNETLNVWT